MTLSFCLMDGSVLLDESSGPETLRIPAARITDLPKTEILQAVPQQTQTPQSRPNNQALIYIVIALLALIAGGFAVAWLKSGNTESPQTKQQGAANSSSTPAPEATRVAQSNANANASTLTEAAVASLIERWRVAQNAADFAAYQSCYDVSFKGVKRTKSGELIYYDYAGWMRDRRRMMAENVGLKLEVKNLKVSISGDSAQVEFDQYYRSPRYSDWGPKVMQVKQTAIGEKIVYEDLKESRPL